MVILYTCIQSFRTRVALLVTLTTPHLHQLSVEGVQDLPIHTIHRIGQLRTTENVLEFVKMFFFKKNYLFYNAESKLG